MRLRSAATSAAAACTAALLLATQAAAGGPQYIHLSVSTGDNSTSGAADLTVTAQHDGYRIRGTVYDDRGSHMCVTLRAVEMHLGSDFGGDDITRACTPGGSVSVDSLTRHHDVVLLVDEPGTVDFESKIVSLTGGQ